MNKKLLVLVSVILAALGVVLFLYCTPYGVGLTNDSAAYVGGARSILNGLGYARIGGDKLPRPITQFPPLYSLIIAGTAKITGLDALDAAKWVNLVCSALNVILFATLIARITKKILPAILGGIAFLCCGPVLRAHIHGLSEVLFLTIFFAVLHVSYAAVEKEHGGLLWLLCGVLLGALMLTRYAALAAFVGTILFALAMLPGWNKRLLAVLQTVIGFALPVVFWLRRNAAVSDGGAVNREIAFHFPASDKLEEGIRTFTGFFLPEYGGWIDKLLIICGGIILLFLALLLIITVKCWFEGFLSRRKLDAGLFLAGLHSLTYLGMLILDALFIDGSTVFDDRMLLPFFVLAVLFIYLLCGMLLESESRLWHILAIAAMLCFALFLFEDESDLIRDFHKDGQGFAGSEWSESETRIGALGISREKTFFSNRQTYLWLMNDQPSYILPPMFNAANFADRENFETERKWMAEEVLSGNAYVVIFNYQDMMEDEGDALWLNTVLEGLPMLQEYPDGAIFGN